MGSKRGGAVLEAPEDNPVSERAWPETDPAPAGAHQRASAGAFAVDEAAGHTGAEEPYTPQRGSFRLRLRGGVPRSIGGRIAAGASCLAVLGVLGFGVAALAHFLLHDPTFLVTTSADIQITGNRHLSRAQALSVFGADLERNIFRIPLAQRRADLERLPWVSHATVMRLLPNQLRVAVAERTPVAFVRQGTRIGLVDGAGILLDMPPDAAGDPSYSFPVLTGLSPEDSETTRAARMEVYRRFMHELDSGASGAGERPSQNISEVDVSNPEDVKAVLTHGGSDILVHFGDENFLDRYHAFEQHLAEWKAQYPKLASADMRYERQVVLEMQPGAGVPVNREAAGAAEPGISAALPRAAAVRKPSLAKAPLKTPVAMPGTKKGDANARMFAALAAAHRADATKKTSDGRVAP